MASKEPLDQNHTSGKQAGLSNTDTKHSQDISADPEKSKKGEGAPETAKLQGPVDPRRPQVSLFPNSTRTVVRTDTKDSNRRKIKMTGTTPKRHKYISVIIFCKSFATLPRLEDKSLVVAQCVYSKYRWSGCRGVSPELNQASTPVPLIVSV